MSLHPILIYKFSKFFQNITIFQKFQKIPKIFKNFQKFYYIFQVVNPMIHVCDKCLHPILIYGRMIPCKHVFCYHCAKILETANLPETGKPAGCGRCRDKVVRVEEANLGTIFMCSHGGSLYGNNGCRRTYLSQRDLQAHIQHRYESNIEWITWFHCIFCLRPSTKLMASGIGMTILHPPSPVI
jgi:hypothetical protein